MTKYFVSTKQTQGQRRNDFSHATEGEIVTLPSECDFERVDGKCGCRRSFTGVDTGLATTTMEVVEGDIDLVSEISKNYVKWEIFSEDEINKFAVDDADFITRVASTFDAGMIVERRGNTYRQRIVSK